MQRVARESFVYTDQDSMVVMIMIDLLPTFRSYTHIHDFGLYLYTIILVSLGGNRVDTVQRVAREHLTLLFYFIFISPKYWQVSYLLMRFRSYTHIATHVFNGGKTSQNQL